MALEDDIRDYVHLSHAYAHARAKLVGVSPDEPALVASFIDSAIFPQLEAIVKAHATWGPALLNNIFIHQTPTVRPITSKTTAVEMGDILFIRRHLAPDGTPTLGRAMLLQAKKSVNSHTGSLTGGNDPIQLELYRDWPQFWGVRRITADADTGVSGYTFPAPAGVSAPATGDFGRYLIVYDGAAYSTASPWKLPATAVAGHSTFGPCIWMMGEVQKSATASSGVACPDDFANWMAEFVRGNEGAYFIPGVSRGTGADHWSLFIQQMLNFATPYTYRARRAGVTKPTHRNAHFQMMMALQTTWELLLQRHAVPAWPYGWDGAHWVSEDEDPQGLKDMLEMLRRAGKHLDDVSASGDGADGGGDGPRPPGDGDDGEPPFGGDGAPAMVVLTTFGNEIPRGLRVETG